LFREQYPTPCQESHASLSDLFKSVESIMLGDTEDESVVQLIISMNDLCQSESGNLDCIVRLWKTYLPFLKKRSAAISKISANQLFYALDSFVAEGISSSLVLSSDGDVQLTVRLQLLIFFMQRLFATSVLLCNHLGEKEHSKCLLYSCTLRGYLASLSAEHESICASYVPKLNDLYRKLIRDNFVVVHHSIMLMTVNRWVDEPNISQVIPMRAFALLGSACLAKWDLERAVKDVCCSDRNRLYTNSHVIVSCVETLLRAIDGLTCLHCGSARDNDLRGLVQDISLLLCQAIGQSSGTGSFSSAAPIDILVRAVSSYVCIMPHKIL
jgi:hypothetical protein